ncbi:catechol O-methyltransferase domain-containing protein 1-like isoform X2 [Ixodes scapularis]|nr:catechol O-methyltransferase domain-containing protein 1-like isoform X2 [Ixodes scapularis]
MSCPKTRNVVTAEAANYVWENSVSLHPAQWKLIKETLKLPKKIMMGDPSQLQLIQLLLKATGAKKYLDIGVFTGCSVLAAALALPPDGKVVGLDDCKEYVDIGRPFWKEAGVEHKIDIRIGNALEILDCAIADGQANTFDFVFIDADKKGYDDYYERCLQLVRRNGLIAFDNVLWDGKVYDAGDKSPDTVAIRRMNEKLKKDTRVDISMLTVGDGLTLALRK